MTEFLQQDRLRLIAVNTTHHPLPRPPRQVPSLQWAIDAETGRPVARWVLSDAPRTVSTPHE
jgi:hypothetical protein